MPRAGTASRRARALTLFYLCSPLDRETLLALLAEATTGARVMERELELPSEWEQIQSVFNDTYLLEPADPSLSPHEVDDDTMRKATPAGREVPFVAATLQRWLLKRPSGPMPLDDAAAEVVLPLITADAWATGAAGAWLDAVIDGDTSGLETGGDRRGPCISRAIEVGPDPG